MPTGPLTEVSRTPVVCGRVDPVYDGNSEGYARTDARVPWGRFCRGPSGVPFSFLSLLHLPRYSLESALNGEGPMNRLLIDAPLLHEDFPEKLVGKLGSLQFERIRKRVFR